jgi:hypothetical protein
MTEREQVGAVAAVLLHDELHRVVARLWAWVGLVLRVLDEPVRLVPASHLDLAAEELAQLVEARFAVRAGVVGLGGCRALRGRAERRNSGDEDCDDRAPASYGHLAPA